jgi:branched-chain amino acid transport system ATP-binding protein
MAEESRMTPLLRVEEVTKDFGGLTAVRSVSFELARDEILGLIGPNGAGKTTLFNMISGSFPPSKGQLYLETRRITNLAPHQACQLGIARTFQIAKPFIRMNIVDNVQVGVFLRQANARQAEAKARDVVDFVGLSRYADQPAQALTTAGRKRLELARALSTSPKLLLLDEVMAGLTPTESIEFVELIRQVRDTGITILVIEHVMKAIMSLSDRIAVLHHGELIAIDTPAAIAADARVIEAYLGEEQEIAED